jgi:hypothetical protein
MKVEDKELVSIALNGLVPSWRLLFRVFVLVRIYHHLQSFGMILCRKKSDCRLVQGNKRK